MKTKNPPRAVIIMIFMIIISSNSGFPGKAGIVYSSPEFSSGEGFFTFQVETLANKRSAEKLLKQLKKKGYPAYIAEIKTQQGKMLYKLRIGKYKTRSEAKDASVKFQKTEHKPSFIVASSPLPQKKHVTAVPSTPKIAKVNSKEPAALKNIDKEREKAEGAEENNTRPENTWPQGEIFYTIQVSTELRKPVACSLVEKLKKKGYPAYISEKKTRKGMMLYKIRIGKYKTKAQAKKVSLNYHNTEKKPYLIVKSKADTVRRIVMPEQEKVPADKYVWPETVSKIFAFRGINGELNLTNSFRNIPETLRSKIVYVSVFPVRFVSSVSRDASLFFDVGGKQKKIKIKGIAFPSESLPDIALNYFEKNLKNEPLRLKYSPMSTTQDGTIFGRLYLRDGTYVNYEMVRHGIGQCRLEEFAPDQQEEFKMAEEAAKKENLGIWADER